MIDLNNGNTPASPTKHNSENFENSNHYTTGLTKREMFAVAAMQGYLSAQSDTTISMPGESEVAKESVSYADALLKELDKNAK